MDLSVAVYLHVHLGRECVHATHTHTVQTAGHFVTVLVKLTTGVEHSHYHLQRTTVLLGVHIHRDTTTVILYGNRIVLVDMNSNLGTETGQCLINRVVHHLIHQVVQTFLRDVTNVHRRALTHRL